MYHLCMLITMYNVVVQLVIPVIDVTFGYFRLDMGIYLSLNLCIYACMHINECVCKT